MIPSLSEPREHGVVTIRPEVRANHFPLYTKRFVGRVGLSPSLIGRVIGGSRKNAREGSNSKEIL